MECLAPCGGLFSYNLYLFGEDCGSPHMLDADLTTIQLNVWYVATLRLGVWNV